MTRSWRLLMLVATLASCGSAPVKGRVAPKVVPHAQPPKDRSPVTQLRLEVYPRFGLAVPGRGGSCRITVTVPDSEEVRWLSVGWQYAFPGDGGGFSRQLDGGSPRQFVRNLERIPPGVSLLAAEILHSDGRVERVEQTFEVF